MDLNETGDTTVEFGGGEATGGSLEVANKSGFGTMLWIGFYTVLLNIVTLTIFRFWGRTHFRRQLWADTTVGGEPLEYTGRGMELFVGFLIAMVVITVPMLIALIGAQVLFGEIGFLIAYFLVYMALLVLIGMALFLARRYHLSRTRYRGMRFAQEGSAFAYGTKYFLYLLLTMVTAGWFAPKMRLDLSKYMWDRAWFGSEKFSFKETTDSASEPVYKSFALAWFGGVLAYAAVIAFFVGNAEALENAGAPTPEFIAMLYGGIFVIALLMVFFVAWHEAVMTRKIIKSLHVAGAHFTSRISTMDIIMLAITNSLIVIFTLGIGGMVAQMRVWKRIANRMEIHGSVDFDAIKQTEHEGPSQGEGLADGLDLVSNF